MELSCGGVISGKVINETAHNFSIRIGKLVPVLWEQGQGQIHR
jgi:hypothetical protein